ncbi:odorant receptor 4-like [Formica exsecta]|uniref:odorant receptor 4-like n=1 Tax=Formica exsecta TaxID=72781 RepID=UPI0011412F31|nr:odorant receptor 4-like [Formica exsecta]
MICLETQHFNHNRTLLLAIGLWPYQKSKLVRLQIILFFGILISFVIFQFTALITRRCTVNFIIKVFSTMIFSSLYVIMYNMFWINSHRVRNLLEQLQYVCNELQDENEYTIIKKCGNNTKFCTLTCTAFAICSTFFAILLPIWPQILGTVLHINESRIQSQAIHITTEYFVDQNKYFYLILLHTNTVICIGATTLTATGTMLIGCAIHACGLFRIASYRMEQIMTTKMFKNVNLKDRAMIYNKKIFYAIEIHCKAIKFCEFLSSTFKGSFFLLIIICVISLSLNIYGIFQNISLGDKEAFLLHLLLASIILLYMFVLNYVGQEITNYNNYVYFTAYNSRWYNAPLQAQKLILFILLKGSRTYNLNIGGVIVASLECFATLTKTSMSYFTVMYSMEE